MPHTKTLISGTAGFILGFILGVLDPDTIVTTSSAIALAELLTLNVLLFGINASRHSFTIPNQVLLPTLRFMGTYIKSTGFMGLVFAAGFTGGFITGRAVRQDYDEEGMTHELVNVFKNWF
jgi:hypothetical protein